MMRRLVPSAALLAALWVAGPAHAGLFDDEEVRRQINDLKAQTTERLDTASRAQIELSNQIESMRSEMAKLRGQVEVLTYELDDQLRALASRQAPDSEDEAKPATKPTKGKKGE